MKRLGQHRDCGASGPFDFRKDSNAPVVVAIGGIEERDQRPGIH